MHEGASSVNQTQTQSTRHLNLAAFTAAWKQISDQLEMMPGANKVQQQGSLGPSALCSKGNAKLA